MDLERATHTRTHTLMSSSGNSRPSALPFAVTPFHQTFTHTQTHTPSAVIAFSCTPPHLFLHLLLPSYDLLPSARVMRGHENGGNTFQGEDTHMHPCIRTTHTLNLSLTPEWWEKKSLCIKYSWIPAFAKTQGKNCLLEFLFFSVLIRTSVCFYHVFCSETIFYKFCQNV